jgi:hypothetical protein
MVNHFLGIMVFTWFFRSTFPMCSTILLMPIPIVLFSSFSTWGFHSHFIEIKSTIGGPIGRNVVCFVHLCVLRPIVATHPICVFLSLANDTHSRSRIRCGSCVFMIAGKIINIRFFSAANEVCNLVSLGVGSFLDFLLPIRIFIFWVHLWGPHHSLSCLWLKFSMRISGQYLVSLCLQIFK